MHSALPGSLSAKSTRRPAPLGWAAVPSSNGGFHGSTGRFRISDHRNPPPRRLFGSLNAAGWSLSPRRLPSGHNGQPHSKFRWNSKLLASAVPERSGNPFAASSQAADVVRDHSERYNSRFERRDGSCVEIAHRRCSSATSGLATMSRDSLLSPVRNEARLIHGAAGRTPSTDLASWNREVLLAPHFAFNQTLNDPLN